MSNYKKLNNYLEKEPDPAFVRRARIIFKELNFEKGDRVLDVGCGRGFYVNAISSLEVVDVTGVDLNKKYLKQARGLVKKKAKLIEADATSLPFDDDSFNKIIASEILEHIKDDKKALNEIYRVLSPGGFLIATVPNKDYPFFWDPINWVLEKNLNYHLPSNVWWLAGIWAGHERLYSESQLRNKFKKANFKIDFIYKTTKYSLPFTHFLLYGIGKNLVESGLFKSFNRFELTETSVLNKLFLWPIRALDRFNDDEVNFDSSVNLIVKATK